jgi:hypothetical protein
VRIEVELPECAVKGRHGVYVVFDADDEVLYIGRTRHLYVRLCQHRSQSAWFRQMRRVEFTPCDGANEARGLEKSMIATFHPAANINDWSPQQRSARQTLPGWTVAKLVEMHEACVEAGRHADVENDALNTYIATLRNAGWTLAAIAEGLTMTREAVRLRQGKATHIDSRAAVPPVPVKVKPAKWVRPVIPEQTLGVLLELKEQARLVNGPTPLDSPLRVASERYSELLAEQVLAGIATSRIAKQLGVTPMAIRARLARHGYLPEVKGMPGNGRYGERRFQRGPRDECHLGHPLSGDNLRLVNGDPTRRVCRECTRRRSNEYAARTSQKRAAS